jgi:L-malate glycosyltransferase
MGFHLCLICDEYPPCNTGGIGIVSRSLARMLVNAGNKVTVVGIYQPYIRKVTETEMENDNGVIVYRLPPSSAKYGNRIKLISERLRLAAWIKNNEKKQGFNIVESPDFTGQLVFYRSNLPKIVRLHGAVLLKDALLHRPSSRLLHFCEKVSLKKANFIIAVSNYCAEMTMQISKVNKKYEVIHNAVDTEFFKPDTSVPVDRKMILYFGTITKDKGISFLFDSMTEVLQKFPNAHLVLLGKDSFKKNGKNCLQYINDELSPHMRTRIQYVGNLSHGQEFLSYIRRASVCVFPTHAEAFGLSVVEAMSCQKPVIFTKYCSGPEILEDGVSGLLCDPHNPHDISRNICKILGDSQFSQMLAIEARKKVLASFSQSIWIEKNIGFYSKVLTIHKYAE